MRHVICARGAVAAALIATVAAAQPVSKIAISVEGYGQQASYRGQALDVGYSARARHMAECLATYPGAYDPKTDLVREGPGVARHCAAQTASDQARR
jgi:hypothetical protein